jgi:hypothetical protein
MSTENNLLENDEPVNKKAFSNGSRGCWRWKKQNCLLYHLNLCKKCGDDTTNIEALYFQTVFDICISDNFLDKDQSFQDTLCHKHYNIFNHSEKNFLIV